MKRFLSPVWFLVVAAAFVLPFITVSCQAPPGLGDLGGELGGQVPTEGFEIRATGLDLVLGNEPEVQAAPEFGDLGQGQQEETEPSLFAIIAFGAAILGIFLSLLRDRTGGVLTLVLGGVAALTLFLLRNDVSGALPAEAAGFLTVRYEIGYWLALGFSVVAIAWGIFRVASRDRVVAVEPSTAPPPAAPDRTMTAGPPAGGTGFERPTPPPRPAEPPPAERAPEPPAEPPAGTAGPPAGSETGGPETAGPPPATGPGVGEPGSTAREDEPPPPPA